MSTVPASSALVQPLQPSSQSHADFYASLLRLQENVLKGRHPLYKISTPDLAGDARHTAQSQTSPHKPLSDGVLPAQTPQDHRPATLPSLKNVTHVQATHSASSVVHQSRHNPTPAGINKPEQLVRAQINLNRLRIERELKKSAETKKTRSGEKDTHPTFGSNDFDCSELLQAATTLVKPVSGFESVTANGDRSSRATPQTDSYYSSKVDSGSEGRSHDSRVQGAHSEDGEIQETSAQPSFEGSGIDTTLQRPRVTGLGPQQLPSALAICARGDYPFFLMHLLTPNPDVTPQVHSATSPVRREDSYEPPSAYELPYRPTARPSVDTATQHRPGIHNLPAADPTLPTTVGRSRESESYSPPPVSPGPPVPVQPQVASVYGMSAPQKPQWNGPPPTSNVPNQKNRKARLKGKGQEASSASGPEKRAPKGKKRDAKKAQPSAAIGNGVGAIPTPTSNGTVNGHGAGHNTLKRRREPEPAENMRRQTGFIEHPVAQPSPLLQYTAHSPEPYIKQEPISPRLQSDRYGAEPPRRLVLRDDGTADIQVDSTSHRYARPERASADTRATSRRSSLVSPRYIQSDPIYLDDSDETSPIVRGRPARHDTDLRRVASLQYARRPLSPSYDEAMPRDMRYARTPLQHSVSHASPRYQYVDEGLQEPQVIRPRYSSPTVVPDDYSPRTMMPPPPPAKRRIVVDEYGNEYIAIPAGSSMRQSVVPEYYEEPRQQREERYSAYAPVQQPYHEDRPRTRAELQVIDLDEDDRVVRSAPRLVPQRRRVEPALHYSPQHADPQRAMYTSRSGSRAPSYQPVMSNGEHHHQYQPFDTAPHARYQESLHPRPYSTHAEPARQHASYVGSPRVGQPAVRASMQRL